MKVDEWPRTHRLTVDEYYRMAEVGLLSRDARVELIEGEIIDMAPIGSRHALVVDMLAERLIRRADATLLVRVQGPVRLSRGSEPQPDITVLERHLDQYAKRHPAPEDVLLIIEVSDTTLRFDLETKAHLYAAHAVPEYWVVDIINEGIHIFRGPGDGEYSDHRRLDDGTVRAEALPFEMDVTGLFGGYG